MRLKLGEIFLEVLFCRFSSKYFDTIGTSNHDHALNNNQMALYFDQITTPSGRYVSKHSKKYANIPSNHDHAHNNSQTVVYFTKISTGINRQLNKQSANVCKVA